MSAFPAYSEQPQEQTQQQQTGGENGASTFGNLGQNQPQSDNVTQAAGAADGAFNGNGNGATPTEGAPPVGGTDSKTTLWYDNMCALLKPDQVLIPIPGWASSSLGLMRILCVVCGLA